MSLPKLVSKQPDSASTDSVVLVVYAPFGTDNTLSHFPDGGTSDLAQHPLYHALLKVATSGVHVCALIDLVQDDSFLVQVPANRPADVRVKSRWKQEMAAPNTLAGLLMYAHRTNPTSAVVLAMEGHGAGYLPEIDRSALNSANITDNGRFEWHISGGQTAPVLPDGSPLLPMGCPLLPMGCPLLPVNHMPLSNWGIGAALARAIESGVPKPAVIHFNNCFNMSVELLHTVAPYAQFATGYCNYNFFTSGEAYPDVFRALNQANTATPEQLAQWFADQNHAMLAAKGNHPTIGCVVDLARMKEITERIDDLSDALLSALRSAAAAERPNVVAMIRQAIIDAKQYDTEPGFQLETPDQLTDIYSLATTLTGYDFGTHGVAGAAAALQAALVDIKRYGDDEAPWVDSNVLWDFSDKALAMNIFLPDPKLDGLWDWRSPYYLEVNPDPTRPMVQPHIIDFVKVTDWVDFLIEYHRDVKFIGLLPAAIPAFPVFNAKYHPPRDGGMPPGKGDGGNDPKDPSKPGDPPRSAA